MREGSSQGEGGVVLVKEGHLRVRGGHLKVREGLSW